MAKRTREVEFTYERTLKLRRPKFSVSRNLRLLDLRKLARGSHSIEVGAFEGCGCDCSVSVNVKDGMVTGISYPKCKEARPISPQTARQFAAARKRLTGNTRRKWTDFPVADLVSRGAVARMTDIIVDGNCFMVCWDEGRGEECVICCFEPTLHWCIGPSEPSLVRF